MFYDLSIIWQDKLQSTEYLIFFPSCKDLPPSETSMDLPLLLNLSSECMPHFNFLSLNLSCMWSSHMFAFFL